MLKAVIFDIDNTLLDFMKMKSVIIFGGCGYIGINLAEYLINQNAYSTIYLADIRKPSQEFLYSKKIQIFVEK